MARNIVSLLVLIGVQYFQSLLFNSWPSLTYWIDIAVERVLKGGNLQ